MFVSNILSYQVLDLTASGTQTTLPFTGLNVPVGLNVDAKGDVFVAIFAGGVLELTAGGSQKTAGP